VVAFVDAGHGNRELHVLELVEADIDGVLQVIGKEEEGGGVFYGTLYKPTLLPRRSVRKETYQTAACSSTHKRF
jgi:hypothetical protein